jgi:hypothetical protein
MARGRPFFFALWLNWKAQNIETVRLYGAVKAFEIFVYHHRHLAVACGIDYAIKKYPHFFELKNITK